MFADAEAYQSRIDQGQTRVLSNLDRTSLRPFEEAATYPISIGVRARF